MTTYNGHTLYTYDSKNKIREWTASSDLKLNSEGYIEIIITHGAYKGKLQNKSRFVKSGKNIGKSNETTIEEQTLTEIQSLYQKQFDQGYVLNIEDYKQIYSAMLSFPYEKKRHLLDWIKNTYWLSSKLDGIRCFIIVDNKGDITFISRTNKPFLDFHHIKANLPNLKNVIFDGELFNSTLPFNIISSLVNSLTYGTVEFESKTYKTEDIQFHCYDFINLDKVLLNFKDRFVNNTDIVTKDSFIRHESIQVKSEEELLTKSKEFVDAGEEGGILRAGEEPYEFDKRSQHSLKVKFMLDEEFQILDIYAAKNDPEKVMLTLVNHHNTTEGYNTFECALKGDKLENLKLLNKKEDLINKSWVKVQYQTLSSYKVPLFGVGIEIREGSVINGKFVPSI